MKRMPVRSELVTKQTDGAVKLSSLFFCHSRAPSLSLIIPVLFT
jgi:hypothetical protein